MLYVKYNEARRNVWFSMGPISGARRYVHPLSTCATQKASKPYTRYSGDGCPHSTVTNSTVYGEGDHRIQYVRAAGSTDNPQSFRTARVLILVCKSTVQNSRRTRPAFPAIRWIRISTSYERRYRRQVFEARPQSAAQDRSVSQQSSIPMCRWGAKSYC